MGILLFHNDSFGLYKPKPPPVKRKENFYVIKPESEESTLKRAALSVALFAFLIFSLYFLVQMALISPHIALFGTTVATLAIIGYIGKIAYLCMQACLGVIREVDLATRRT